jgi:hypothetical protein
MPLMSFFDSLRARLAGGTVAFNKLELRVLEALKVSLDGVSAEKLQRRINQVNRVHRLCGGEEVNTYQVVRGKPVLDPTTALVQIPEEHLFRTITITSSSGTRFSAKIWLVNGVFFSIEFDRPTEHLIDEEIAEISASAPPHGSSPN